jgi:hypothetical protein
VVALLVVVVGEDDDEADGEHEGRDLDHFCAKKFFSPIGYYIVLARFNDEVRNVEQQNAEKILKMSICITLKCQKILQLSK